MEDGSKSGGGIGFLEALTIAFIVLRLCGVIDWPLVLVLAPILIPIALVLFCIACWYIASRR